MSSIFGTKTGTIFTVCFPFHVRYESIRIPIIINVLGFRYETRLIFSKLSYELLNCGGITIFANEFYEYKFIVNISEIQFLRDYQDGNLPSIPDYITANQSNHSSKTDFGSQN